MPTLAAVSGAELPNDVIFDGYSLAPVLRGEKEKHRDWIYSHLDDGRVLRDSRWLLEIAKAGRGERFFDCGECRDGSNYLDVTNSLDPEVVAARRRFAEILATVPEPKPNSEVDSGSAEQNVHSEIKQPAGRKASGSQGTDKSKLSRFKIRDQNHDGHIDHDEFLGTVVAKNRASAETRFRKMDVNGDGKVTEEEFDKVTASEK